MMYDYHMDVSIVGDAGIFELEGGCWDISVQLLPLTGGNLPLPTITLFQYIPTDLSPNLGEPSSLLLLKINFDLILIHKLNNV